MANMINRSYSNLQRNLEMACKHTSYFFFSFQAASPMQPKLICSSILPQSHNAGITGICHHPQVHLTYFNWNSKIYVNVIPTIFISKVSLSHKSLLMVLHFPPTTEHLLKNYFSYFICMYLTPNRKHHHPQIIAALQQPTDMDINLNVN